MNFLFNPNDVRSIGDLRRTRHVYGENGTSSENRLLIMYSIDHLNVKTVVRLIDGSTVGQDVSYVVRMDDLGGLPVRRATGDPSAEEVKTRYEFVFDADVGKSSTCYQVFVGDMYASTATMYAVFPTADAALIGLSEMFKLNPKAPHAYTIKYAYKKESQYIPFIGC